MREEADGWRRDDPHEMWVLLVRGEPIAGFTYQLYDWLPDEALLLLRAELVARFGSFPEEWLGSLS
jgi:hypothetical protein